jgi:hypothetical protein
VLACVAVDGGIAPLVGPGRSREQARLALTPPRTALPREELEARLAGGPLAPWWSPQVARAALSVFETGADGLARARLPFAVHMAILDDLLDSRPEQLWPSIGCPTWLVACQPLAAGAPGGGQDPRPARSASAKEARLAAAGTQLRSPRLLQWAGAVHDVPLQWPALVAGLVRAARDETLGAAPAGKG